MPKIKTVKGVKARFKITGTGRLVARRAGRRHLLGSKRAKIKRQLRRPMTVSASEQRTIKSLVPYGAG